MVLPTINDELNFFRKLITIDGSKVTTETGMPIGIDVNLPGVSSDGSDVRLAKLDGTPISREIECVGTPNAEDVMIWYPFNTTAGQNDQFWIYWGNHNLSEPASGSAYGSQSVWDSNFKAVYHLNQEPNGAGANTILDSTSNAKHATQHNFTVNSLVNSDYGKGIHFDDVNDYISFPQLYTSLSEVTITVKFKSDVADTAEQRLYIYGGDGSYVITSINSGTANLIRSFVSAWSSTTTAYPVTSWRVISTQAKDGISLYTFVDGNRIGANVVPTFASIGSDRLIGAGDTAPNIRADGIMSEVRISTIKRSDNYLSTESNNLKNPTSSGTSPFYLSFGLSQHQRITPQFI